jgi:hypothetical protein
MHELSRSEKVASSMNSLPRGIFIYFRPEVISPLIGGKSTVSKKISSKLKSQELTISGKVL